VRTELSDELDGRATLRQTSLLQNRDDDWWQQEHCDTHDCQSRDAREQNKNNSVRRRNATTTTTTTTTTTATAVATAATTTTTTTMTIKVHDKSLQEHY
jgi:hypothetical protein